MARRIVLFASSLLLFFSLDVSATAARSLKSFLQQLESRTGYRFLYRESLIRNRTISLPDSSSIVMLIPVLEKEGLSLSIDEARKVAIITEKKTSQNPATSVQVAVIDAGAGSSMPYATVTWFENTQLKGFTTGENGRFTLSADLAGKSLRIGYVGYKTVFVEVDALLKSNEPVVSLQPDVLESAAAVVSDARYRSVPDSSAGRWSRSRVTGFAGERNVMRSLEAFPAVSPVVGLNRGLVLRGSNPDAFQVLLDGMTIFHQSHLFGLIDAFQSDALQSVAFHYATTPAQFPSPPGGLMAFYTRDATNTRVSGNAGISSSSFKGLLEIPILPTRASLLIGGRNSLINSIDWFGNRELISFGLDVEREHSPTGSDGISAEERVLRNRQTTASFSDIHAKLSADLGRAARLQLAFYSGTDKAKELADRYFLVNPNTPVFTSRFRLFPVQTENNWQNTSWSALYQQTLNPKALLTLQTGGSGYESSYLKGDFVYQRPPSGGNQQERAAIDTFSNRNLVREYKINPHVDLVITPAWSVSFGAAAFLFEAVYEETNLQRSRPVNISRSYAQLDAYLQSDFTFDSGALLQTGIRSHFYEAGGRFRLSPRFLLEIPAGEIGSLKAGYSRNYQFLHRFNLNQQISADVWSLTGDDEPITSSDHFFAGWKRKLWSGASLSADVYSKQTRYMRLHELSANVFGANNVLDNPRFYDNNGYSKGIELFFDQQIALNRFAVGYTRSNSQISNERVMRGERYDAAWDRLHQIQGRFETTVFKILQLHVSTLALSGTPNQLAQFEETLPPNQRYPDEKDRLSWYYRTDAGVTAMVHHNGLRVEGTFSIFNVFGRKNPWYRTVVEVLEEDAFRRTTPRYYPVDVYDMGFRPSFEIVIRF